MIDVEKFIGGLHDYMAKQFSPVFKRLEELEGRSPIPGEKGDPGAPGENGEPGEKGEPGKDAEPVSPETLREMVAEEVLKVFHTITLPKDGEKGDPGESVPVETVKAMVAQEVASVITNIELPADGQDGRDALDIEILPAIDPEKSYVRGTYAQHNAGLWRSYAKTSGMKGWECLVSGIASIDLEQVDHRTNIVRMVTSEGKTLEKTLTVPGMVYMGIYNEQNSYIKGDTVTCAGSLWHCDQDGPGKPGLKDSGWTLCAKKGRDGK